MTKITVPQNRQSELLSVQGGGKRLTKRQCEIYNITLLHSAPAAIIIIIIFANAVNDNAENQANREKENVECIYIIQR